MKNRCYPKRLGWLMLLALGSCVDPYRPPEVTAPDSYLVVNGFFNSAPGTTTTIQLSRTQNLTDSKTPPAETKAQVTIESGSKVSYSLKEGSGGVYTLSGVVPQANETYRLRIRTAQGKEYVSDFVPVNVTPPVDSLSWRIENEGVQINVNTHDPTNNTRYYRWEFDETWEYTSPYYSAYELKNNRIVSRAEDVYRCWGSSVDKTIQLGSSARLSQDVISQRPLTFITGTSLKLGLRYSIQVKQYALTQDAYNYYDQLARITQNVGSIFDPQPSQITGNIRSTTNTSELVMGFFRVGTVQTRRIYIAKTQLPYWLTQTGVYTCLVDTLTPSKIIERQPAIINEFDASTYLTTSFDCVDCRLRGGVIKKPDFWDQ
ncbi:DUF4249 domain-containing protein [Spirosoma sp. RP8]|uniref:DUF4249 domain-containing protein n=1 Tax=Spirosoma liriopis TaxID=2937440 RepID=A0ABT0HMD5_9BACT|nr:DUF4249 domain-containing protein [Spirosoma liriopis]MCK8493027.1 DUF4249 domain-containing protein [Spirosoma liriopis]